MIRYFIANYGTFFVKQFTFPGGEVGVSLGAHPPEGHKIELVKVLAHIRTSEDLMALMMTADALRRAFPRAKIDLSMPYIPYARQDRVCNEGESLSIAVLAMMINACGFNQVFVLDAHSDVAPALINNCVNRSQAEFAVQSMVQSRHDYVIVAPDAGAYKKAHAFAKMVGAAEVVTANKIRDTKTGIVESVQLTGNVENKKVLVIDDILDGGATFIQLGTALHLAGVIRLELFVTHGIFSKGYDDLTTMYDMIYTTNSFHFEAAGHLRPDGQYDPKIRWYGAQ